jgi:hypothetical protein
MMIANSPFQSSGLTARFFSVSVSSHARHAWCGEGPDEPGQLATGETRLSMPDQHYRP